MHAVVRHIVGVKGPSTFWQPLNPKRNTAFPVNEPGRSATVTGCGVMFGTRANVLPPTALKARIGSRYVVPFVNPTSFFDVASGPTSTVTTGVKPTYTDNTYGVSGEPPSGGGNQIRVRTRRDPQHRVERRRHALRCRRDEHGTRESCRVSPGLPQEWPTPMWDTFWAAGTIGDDGIVMVGSTTVSGTSFAGPAVGIKSPDGCQPRSIGPTFGYFTGVTTTSDGTIFAVGAKSGKPTVMRRRRVARRAAVTASASGSRGTAGSSPRRRRRNTGAPRRAGSSGTRWRARPCCGRCAARRRPPESSGT